jgi:DNA-binding beta-propeller fold protein YncE
VSNARNRRIRVQAAAIALLAGASSAGADPAAYVVNADSHTVSVVDVAGNLTRANIPTWDGVSPSAGREPSDAVVDPRSGRVFVSANHRLVSFDGRLARDRAGNETLAAWRSAIGWHEVSQNDPAYDMGMTGVQDEASGLALDEAGRRLFMSHEEIGTIPNGFIHEFSIADPASPKGVKRHDVSGARDLREIAWDARYQQLYVVADDGTILRASSTGLGNLSFTTLFQGSAGAPNPGGILVDPAGGIWLTSRAPGKLVRIAANGTRTEYPIAGAQHPRGLAFDRGTPANLLIAIDDLDKVKRFTIATGSFADAMSTDDRPQDVGVTLANQKLSANRFASGNGSVTRDGMSIATTQEKSIAMEVTDVGRLTAQPASHAFCYNRPGDVAAPKTFTIRNTRLDRQMMTLGGAQVGGSNPANYTLTSDSCNATLAWGSSCSFTLRFVASGPSSQPPASPFLNSGPQVASWPAQVTVATTAGAASPASVTIPVRGSLYLNPCSGGFVLLPRL